MCQAFCVSRSASIAVRVGPLSVDILSYVSLHVSKKSPTGRTHWTSRTPKNPEYLIALSQLIEQEGPIHFVDGYYSCK